MSFSKLPTPFVIDEDLHNKCKQLRKERDELRAINELLVQKIDGLRAKVARFEEVSENTTKADLVQNCRVLAIDRDAYKKWIEHLSFWEWNPNQFEHQVVVPLEPGEYAYVGNRKPEGLK